MPCHFCPQECGLAHIIVKVLYIDARWANRLLWHAIFYKIFSQPISTGSQLNWFALPHFWAREHTWWQWIGKLKHPTNLDKLTHSHYKIIKSCTFLHFSIIRNEPSKVVQCCMIRLHKQTSFAISIQSANWLADKRNGGSRVAKWLFRKTH